MTAIICTLIICCAVVAMYWLYLNHQRLDDGGVDVKIGGSPYRAYEPQAYSQPSEIGDILQEIVDKPAPEQELIPKLAQEYLDAAKKLEAEGAEQDMEGRVFVGDMRREAAGVCRDKAEKLIKEAN